MLIINYNNIAVVSCRADTTGRSNFNRQVLQKKKKKSNVVRHFNDFTIEPAGNMGKDSFATLFQRTVSHLAPTRSPGLDLGDLVDRW